MAPTELEELLSPRGIGLVGGLGNGVVNKQSEVLCQRVVRAPEVGVSLLLAWGAREKNLVNWARESASARALVCPGI